MPDGCAAEAHIFLESESCCINESFVNKYTKIGIPYAIGVVSELNNCLDDKIPLLLMYLFCYLLLYRVTGYQI